MTPSRAAVVVVGVTLVAVWAAAAAGGRAGAPQGAAPVAQVRADLPDGGLSPVLEAAAARLGAHAPRALPPAARDPFRFGGPSAARSGRPAPGPQPARAEPPADELAGASARGPRAPDVVLEGMAESQVGEAVERTAIVTVDGGLVLAGLGVVLGDRYEIVALSADSVELEDVVSRARSVCRLKTARPADRAVSGTVGR